MKHLTTEETRDLGVVLEVNRQLLHPRGLALEVSVPSDDQTVAIIAMRSEQVTAFTDLLGWLKTKIEEVSKSAETGFEWRRWAEQVEGLLGEAREEPNAVILSIQDHRDDSEGVYFGDIDAEDLAKAERFEALSKTAGRLEGLGYFVLPLAITAA